VTSINEGTTQVHEEILGEERKDGILPNQNEDGSQQIMEEVKLEEESKEEEEPNN